MLCAMQIHLEFKFIYLNDQGIVVNYLHHRVVLMLWFLHLRYEWERFIAPDARHGHAFPTGTAP